VHRRGAPRARSGSSSRARRHDGSDGQSLVEFSLILLPLMLVLLGIIQFGLIFNAYVTMTNAAREGARTGSIYVHDRTLSKDQNDTARNEAIRLAVTGSMNLLGKTAPHFTNGTVWTKSGQTWTNGDLTVVYAVPSGVTDTDSRVAQTVTVRTTYHQDLIVPLISSLLPRDTGGRLGLTSEATMVIN
jgi:Flp pilus assembly protein TadG